MYYHMIRQLVRLQATKQEYCEIVDQQLDQFRIVIPASFHVYRALELGCNGKHDWDLVRYWADSESSENEDILALAKMMKFFITNKAQFYSANQRPLDY